MDQANFVCNIEDFYAKLMNIQTKYRHYDQKQAHENVVHQLTSAQLDIAGEIRSISNMIRNRATLELKTLGIQYKSTMYILRQLAKDPSIIITRPDKGRAVVVMSRLEYNEKMQTILNDTSTFRMIDNDPTYDNENKLITLLLKLKKKKFITDREYDIARPTGSRPARIYGLPKLHKSNYPLRPVMSATKTVAYGLGKILSNRLSHLRKSPYVIKDSSDFVKKIRLSKNIDKLMVSFDVVSLFTNIPLDYTIKLILDKMYPECDNKCLQKREDEKKKETKKKKKMEVRMKCQQREDFNILLNTATSEVNFLFNNQMYVQYNGVAMGAPIAPIIADIFMSHMEISLMEQLKQQGIHEWYRYVDDTFVLIEPATKIENILNLLHNFHDSIKFTHVTENEDSLPFLEVKIYRSPGESNFQTTIYRKDTYTGLMINYFSFVPTQFKKASIVNLIQRSISICSTYKALAYEFEHIRKVAMANSYPLAFIEQHIAIGLNKYVQLQQRTKKENNTMIGCEKEKIYFELPYVGNTTDALKKKFKHVINKYRPSLEPIFYTRSPPAIQTLFKVKDSIDKFMQSNIVYHIQCHDCKEIYIGKTERQMIRCLMEHGAPKELLQHEVIHNPRYKTITQEDPIQYPHQTNDNNVINKTNPQDKHWNKNTETILSIINQIGDKYQYKNRNKNILPLTNESSMETYINNCIKNDIQIQLHFIYILMV